MNKLSVGIDPGQKGGMAYILDIGDETYERVLPYSDENLLNFAAEVRVYMKEVQATVTCLEKVGAMPGQGVTSMFTFGRGYGFIEGVLQALSIPYQLIPPQTWKKEFSLNTDKQKSIQVCKRLFPEISLLASERCRKDHDGMAEAMLMAVYAKRKL